MNRFDKLLRPTLRAGFTRPQFLRVCSYHFTKTPLLGCKALGCSPATGASNNTRSPNVMEQKPFFAFSRLLQNDAHIHKFDPKMCWSCKERTSSSSVFCDNKDCQVILPLGNDLTYFDVLTGSKPTFDVDIKKLRQKFLRLQQVAHPDTFAKASDTEKGLADVLSSWINKGYSTLRNPLSRAKYLLKLEGHEITEAQKLNDPTLIMEVLEQREEVESCKSEEQLEAIRKYNSEKINETLDQLSKAFNDKDYQQAHDLTIQLQYWDNIQEAINNWSG